jgi:hypothetical protein
MRWIQKESIMILETAQIIYSIRVAINKEEFTEYYKEVG